MSKTQTQDELVQKLIDAAQEKKKTIERAEKPSWLTNSSFGYYEDSSSRINIRVVNKVEELVKMLAFLKTQKEFFDDAAKELKYTGKFTWLGFTYEDWAKDFELRATKINISDEKNKLEAIESRLAKLISPELKKQMELEAIQKELGL